MNTLQASTRFHGFFWETLDPNHPAIIQEIDDDSEALQSAVLEEAGLWDAIREQGDFGDYEFVKDGYYFDVNFQREGDGFSLLVKIMDARWHEQRREAMAHLFPGDQITFSIQELAEHHSLQAAVDIPAAHTPIDVHAIHDRLGKGIDTNIQTLILQLNQIGLETKGSCGGHSDGRLPYLTFATESFQHLIGQLLNWKQATGFNWRLHPVERDLVLAICVVPPHEQSLAEAQEDLDNLSTHLKQRLSHVMSS